MPVNYQLPPWLQQQAAPNPATAYIQSLHEGAQIGIQQQQLQQRRVLAERELADREANTEREANLAKQKIEYDRAMHEQEMALEQQKVAQDKAVSDSKIQETSRRFAAQQRVQQAMAGGVPVEQAMLQEAANLDLGSGDLRSLLAAARPPKPFVPQTMTKDGQTFNQLSPNRWTVAKPDFVPKEQDIDGKKYVETSRGHWTPEKSNAPDPDIKAQMSRLDKTRADIQAKLRNKGMFDLEVQQTMKFLGGIDKKEAAAITSRSLEGMLQQLDKEYEALAKKKTDGGTSSGTSGGGKTATHIFKDGKLVPIGKSVSSTDDGEEEEDLAGEPDEEEVNA
jgi:hypothetical protein